MAPVNPKILESLNYGINQEIKSYVFYLEAARQIDNEEFKATLMKLAGEEKEHYQVAYDLAAEWRAWVFCHFEKIDKYYLTYVTSHMYNNICLNKKLR